MKTYLINMPFCEQEYTKFSEKWDYIEDEYIGVNIIHALLLKYNVEVTRCDKNCLADMIADVMTNGFDVVMISVMQTSARLTHEFVKRLRAEGYKGIIFIGGWFAKLSWKYIYDNDWDVDYVCYVDAENVFPLWLDNPRQEIIGIVTRENYLSQAKLTKNQVRETNSWPDNYCSPLREAGRKTYRLETSRGCPHACCTFCSLSCANIVKDKWKPLPLEIIISEIIKIHDTYGVTRFSLTDDDMLGPIDGAEARAKEFHDAIKKLPFNITFSGSISVRAATNGRILDYLVDAGLEQLGIGFESADAEQLKRYNKQQSLEENFVAAKNIVDRGINLIPGLITFDPFATKETIRKNLDFLFNHLHHYDLGKLTKKLYVITGTPIAKLVEKNNLLVGDYLNYEYRFMHEETEQLYQAFQKYTELVKDVQIEINKRGLAFNKTIGSHHQNVVERILANEDWEAYAIKEIDEIRKEMDGVQ